MDIFVARPTQGRTNGSWPLKWASRGETRREPRLAAFSVDQERREATSEGDILFGERAVPFFFDQCPLAWR